MPAITDTIAIAIASRANTPAAPSHRTVEMPQRLVYLASWQTACCAALLLLSACGGGGGGGGGGGANNLAPVLDANVSKAPNLCVAPRGGINPDTNAAYPDSAGTLAQEKSWVRGYIDDTYLWYDEVPTLASENYPTTIAYFNALKTPAVTTSGRAKDRFHFTYSTDVWRALSQSGASAGYGMEVVLLKSTPPRLVRVAFTDPNTPASAAAITRGSRIIAVDGTDVATGAAAALNAGIFPGAAGEAHVFTIENLAGVRRDVTLTSSIVTSTPVQNAHVETVGTRKIGYLLFNDHIATAEGQLIDAINLIKAGGATELVIDVRYNGGGYLAIASQLAYMVSSPAVTAGKTFERLEFNRKNPFNATVAQVTTPFYPQTQIVAATRGQPLPQLNFNRVALLTGPGTCSASESIANGLRGVDVRVDLIGETTCGKPYGFIPQDNCGTTYFAIQFKGVNNKGQGDYADGLAPTCQVGDDFSRALGDPLEARFAAAINYIATNVCPAPTTTVATSNDSALSKSGAADNAGQTLQTNRQGIKILQLEQQ